MRYDGKVTIVTGGSAGIGEGCVRVFAGAGSTVVFCSRGEKPGRALEAELAAEHPGRVLFLRCDVSNEDEVRGARRRGRAALRPPRLPRQQRRPAPAAPPDRRLHRAELRALLELNFVSMFVACQQALPHLRRTKGNVINMSSLVGAMAQLHATTYVATKGAITAFSKALAVDEAAHGVRVNVVSPGNVWTPLWESAAADTPDPDRRRAARRGGAARSAGWGRSRRRAGCASSSPPRPPSRPASTTCSRRRRARPRPKTRVS